MEAAAAVDDTPCGIVSDAAVAATKEVTGNYTIPGDLADAAFNLQSIKMIAFTSTCKNYEVLCNIDYQF